MATIVEQIRQGLAKRDGISADAMRPLAQRYALEVSRVNDRLGAAVTLLHKGLRSEAIQSVSLSPNAIDDAAKLDFAEVEEWFDILQFLEIAVPPLLNSDLADQLNEAIIESQPIDALMVQHRRLAIARAPLPWRLKVLRRIAAIDAANPIWQEDQEAWEKVRHQQIAAQIPALFATADIAPLRNLHHELTQSAWRLPPDTNLVRQVEAQLQQRGDQENLDRLSALALKLNDAFCEFDALTARDLLKNWNELTAQLTTPLPGDLLEQVEPSIAWIAEMDREAAARQKRAAAIGKLENQLDLSASLDELEKAYHRTTVFDEPPPDELIQRYTMAVQERQLGKKRRFQAVVCAILAVSVISAGGLAWRQYEAGRSAQIAATEKEFRSLIETDNLDSATLFYENLQASDPRAAALTPLASLAGQLQSKLTEERQRSEQFATYLAEADSDDAAEIDLSALNRAEGLSKLEAEKAEVHKLRRRFDQWQSELQQQQSSALQEKLADQRNQLDQIESGQADEQAMVLLASVIEKLNGLPGKYPRASASSKELVVAAKTRAFSMRDAVAMRARRLQAERDGVSKLIAATSLDQLVDQLKLFMRDAPQSSMTAEFQTVVAERPLWSKALAWNDYSESVAKSLANRMPNDQVRSTQALKDTIDNTIAQSLASLPSTTRERFERHEARSKLLDRVLGSLADAVIADLYTVIEAGGNGDRRFVYKTYYERNGHLFKSPFLPNQTPKRRSIEFVVNATGAVETGRLEGDYVVLSEPANYILSLTNFYLENRSLFLTDWEGEFLKLAALLAKRKDLDSQIKEMLMQHLLSGASEGSDWLSKALANELLTLKNRAGDRAGWYQPQALTETMAEEVGQSLVLKLAGLYRSRPQINAEIADLRQQRYTWVGLLLRNAKGTIEFRDKPLPSEDGVLAVVRAAAEAGDKVDWVQIGSVHTGVSKLKSDSSDLVAGRPVFFLPKR